MGILQRVLRRTTARRSFDGALPASRRGICSFGPTGPETLAAAAPLRSRARHAAANNAWIAKGGAAILGEAAGAGIEAPSAHPDPDQRPVWRRVLTRLYLGGEINDLAPALKVEWLPPRPMQVGPEKDTRALVAQIEAGLTSRRQAVASLGWNVAELDAEIPADRDRAAALDLTFTGDPSNAD